MNKIVLLFKKNWILIIILLLGIFLRTYKSYEYFSYAHDLDLAAWIVRDVVVDKHIRLIGQETSTQGIFIGPLYYYLQIPFYLLFNMQPTGLIVMATLFGIFSIWSFYYIFANVFQKKDIGYIAGFIYAISFSTVMNDRGTVPTTPVFLWTGWFFYALDLIYKGNHRKAFITLGVLIALIWHLNFGLVVLLTLIPFALYFSKKRIIVKDLVPGRLYLFILSLPLIAFEIKHGFIQTKALITSLIQDQGSQLTLIDQSKRVYHISSQIITNIIWYPDQIYYYIVPLLTLIMTVYYFFKKKISKYIFWIIILWSIPTLIFFSLYSKILSEYYLNGIILAWITMITLILYNLLAHKILRIFGYIFLVIFIFINISKMLNFQDNREGYIYRRAIVSDIRKDAEAKGYPCVAVSYITKPGYNLGYRYLFVLENMHVNNPESLSPVYTIVFPLDDTLFPVHKTFGAIGLIYPDYSRYNKEDVQKSCSGENSNLTDPMFGFTK